MQQLELFKIEQKNIIPEEGKLCKKCNMIKHHEKDFHVAYTNTNSGSTFYKRICKLCENASRLELNSIRKSAPKQPSDRKCECCGEVVRSDVFHLDHCHVSLSFRGWLCHSCNIGLGHLGDTLDSLKKAVSYLERFEE